MKTARTTVIQMPSISGSYDRLSSISKRQNYIYEFFRDSMSEPFPPELKGSPGFEAVTTVYKNTLNADSEDNTGNNRQGGISFKILKLKKNS